MATTADAEVILKLYELRREETMRKARRFLIAEFWPRTFAELDAVRSGFGTPENESWRQVLTYWEMAASLVLRGAVDADLYLDSQGEGIFIYTKFQSFRAELERTGPAFMPKTATLVAEYLAARAAFEAVMKRLAERAASGKS